MVSFVAGGADPGRGAERLSKGLFGRERDSYSYKGIRVRVLIVVA